jgi:hypothetical protein
VLLGIRAILWPQEPPPDGKTVRRQLFQFLSRKRREAPQRGRGAYLRRFIEHVQKVTRSYAKGLFHCYNDPRIPQTTNKLEGLNGAGKRNLRRCSGRKSTANGPGSSSGPMYMFAVALHTFMPVADIDELLREAIDPERYRAARRLLDEVRSPQAQRRSMLRDPDRYLESILARWRGP